VDVFFNSVRSDSIIEDIETTALKFEINFSLNPIEALRKHRKKKNGFSLAVSKLAYSPSTEAQKLDSGNSDNNDAS